MKIMDVMTGQMTLEKLALMVARGFEDVQKQLDAVNLKIEGLRKEAREIRSDMEIGFSRVWDEFAIVHSEIAGIHRAIDTPDKRVTSIEHHVGLE